MSSCHVKRHKVSFVEGSDSADIAENRLASEMYMSTCTHESMINHHERGIPWRGIAGTVVVELLVLLALGAAVVRYVEWSSDAALAEFMSATEPSVYVTNHSGEFSTPVQALKVRADCDRKG
jgi:hypothetical protein